MLGLRSAIQLALFICLFKTCFSQSSSVFDANYFNLGNTSPLIEVGKGINITDIYKPTKYCFAPIKTKLKSSGAGYKTSVSIYYTKNESDYSTLRNFGSSGAVGFLNLFSFGGSEFTSYFNKTSQNVERVVFVAKVDFGVFSIGYNPVLNPEPKALLAKNKIADFIDQYGTHYINAVRKESSVWIVLTRKNSTNQHKNGSGDSFHSEFFSPSGSYGGFEVSDDSEIDKSINSEEYALSIEIKGPSIGKMQLESNIKSILSDAGQGNKTDAIKGAIGDFLTSLNNPEQAMITQYYYAPFELKPVKWNEKKQSRLVNINKNVVKVYQSKSIVDHLTAPDGMNYISRKFDKDIVNFSKKSDYKDMYIQKYQAILPAIAQYKFELDTTIRFLETIYKKCSSLYCDLDSLCGFTGPYEEKIAELTAKVNNELNKMSSVKAQAAVAAETENSIPECEKESVGYVTVLNLSTNPYDFYEGDNLIETIRGNTTVKYKTGIGTHNYRAVQVRGYIMYATVNYRKVIIQKICEEATIKVGFED